MFGYNYFEGHVLIALLVVVGRQFLHAVVCNFLLVIMLGAWVYFHSDVAVQSFYLHLAP